MFRICVPDSLKPIELLSAVFQWTGLAAFALGVLFILASQVSPRIREIAASHWRTSIGIAFIYPIVALLASIYLYSQLPHVRSMVTEGLSLASAGKTAISEYFVRHGELPSNNKEAGMAASSDISRNWVQSVSVGESGVMTVTLVETCDNHTIMLTPSIVNGSVRWDCSGGTLAAKYRPSSCR
jgi:type IV pilus assembly protein PilA